MSDTGDDAKGKGNLYINGVLVGHVEGPVTFISRKSPSDEAEAVIGQPNPNLTAPDESELRPLLDEHFGR